MIPYTLVVLALLASNDDVLGGQPLAQEAQEWVWHHDYAQAQRLAKLQRKMLFIYFESDKPTAALQKFESVTLRDERVREKLRDMVLAKVPLDATIKVDGKKSKLLDHASFREMLHRPGIAIVDYRSEDPNVNGQVVSEFPFQSNKVQKQDSLRTILDLPEGTLTQRTMIYAVRMHPETPASTRGTLSNVLADEAESHSTHQANIRSQGHHQWESRFHRINRRLGNGSTSQEVVAESWPGQTLVDAAIECVHSWRQSPGHWSAVRSRHGRFAYDIKRGRNGIWYATGLFANR
jgi:hypothetical protein